MTDLSDPQMGELDSSKAPIREFVKKDTWSMSVPNDWIRISNLPKIPPRWNRFWLWFFFGARFTKNG